MKKTILILVFIQTFCMAQKKATNSEKPELCHYPKEEMKGKTQKEQLVIMRSYLECKQKLKESANQNQNKEYDIEKKSKEREAQEQQQQEREQNSNAPIRPSPQSHNPEKEARQNALEAQRREARERAAAERRKKRESDGN